MAINPQLHSKSPKKAKEKRTLVLRPGYINNEFSESGEPLRSLAPFMHTSGEWRWIGGRERTMVSASRRR